MRSAMNFVQELDLLGPVRERDPRAQLSRRGWRVPPPPACARGSRCAPGLGFAMRHACSSRCVYRGLELGTPGGNPVRELERKERPKTGDGVKRALSEQEIADVLDGATDMFKPLIATMVFGGLRLGEALGLRWQNIDFGEGFVHVSHQLGRQRELLELKTAKGQRNVVLIPQLAKLLREHRMASSSHSFRHTFASLLIVGLKLDPVSVAAQLGHSNPATTLRFYAHLFEQAKHADEARDKLAAGFGHLVASTS
jgi:integrase